MRNHWVDHALGNEAIGFVGLAIVGKVRTDQALEAHPEKTIVKLKHEATGGCTSHHGAAFFHHIHRCTKRAAPRVLEHDVGVFADECANIATKAAPLTFVVSVVVVPELVVGFRAIDDRFTAHLTQNSLFVR